MFAGSGLKHSQPSFPGGGSRPVASSGISRLIASSCVSRLIAAAAFDDFRRPAAQD
jgi:hypothetical protein